jgi:hypothetical protein
MKIDALWAKVTKFVLVKSKLGEFNVFNYS